MTECLPYYVDLFDKMKAAASPAPVAVVAPAMAD
jgi:3beta-hydroxy-Delta5-steroid dehydrogenase / steroid Delta-isomerase